MLSPQHRLRCGEPPWPWRARSWAAQVAPSRRMKSRLKQPRKPRSPTASERVCASARRRTRSPISSSTERGLREPHRRRRRRSDGPQGRVRLVREAGDLSRPRSARDESLRRRHGRRHRRRSRARPPSPTYRAPYVFIAAPELPARHHQLGQPRYDEGRQDRLRPGHAGRGHAGRTATSTAPTSTT